MPRDGDRPGYLAGFQRGRRYVRGSKRIRDAAGRLWNELRIDLWAVGGTAGKNCNFDSQRLQKSKSKFCIKSGVEEPESIGEAAVEVRDALRENAAMRRANTKIRSHVLAVKEKAAQLEAIPKIKSGNDQERS